MKPEQLQDAIGDIRDEYILDAHGKQNDYSKVNFWQKKWNIIVASIFFLVIAGTVIYGQRIIQQGARKNIQMYEKENVAVENTQEPEKKIKLNINIIERPMDEEMMEDISLSDSKKAAVIRPEVPADLKLIEEKSQGRTTKVVYQSENSSRKLFITTKIEEKNQMDELWKDLTATDINGGEVYFFRYEDETEEVLHVQFSKEETECEMEFHGLTQNEIWDIVLSAMEQEGL